MIAGPDTARARRRHRPKEKLDAIYRVVAGEDVASVADSLGIDESLIAKWHQTFIRAGTRAIKFTFDEGEVPTIDDLRLHGQRAFPVALSHECANAVCFFCAQFYGKNDVIHLATAGMEDVTLVDLDTNKLSIMENIYPQQWTYRVGDAYAVAAEMNSQGERFDLVVCDPYSSAAPTVLFDKFSDFFGIAAKYFVTLVSQPMLSQRSLEADAGALGEHLSEVHDRKIQVADLIKRSSHEGGIYWAVLQADA